MGVLISHHRGSQAVSEADLQKAFSALLMSLEPGALYPKKRDPRCDLEKSEFCSTHGVVKELLDPQKGSAARVQNSPRAQEATRPKQEGATGECAGSEDVENWLCTSDGSVKEALKPQDGSVHWSKQERALGGFLAPVEWIRSHPWIILVLLALLVTLVVALGVSLAVCSVRTVPDTPVLPPCPKGWIGHNGICCFLSRDHLSWDQAQARCSELGASLAVLRDEEMELLFPFSRNVDYWLGLRRRDQRLQWGDGSSFNSSVPVLGNAECVFLADDKLRSAICSNEMRFICSRPETRL